MKLIADEHVPPGIQLPLSRAGIEVLRVAVERPGAPDEDNLIWSTTLGCAFLTFDDDYLRLAAAGTEHAGLIFCHQLQYEVGSLARAVEQLYERGGRPKPGEVVFL